MCTRIVGFVLLVVFLGFTKPASSGAKLQLEVENIQVAEGWIWVGIYDSEETFLNKEQAVLVDGYRVENTGTLQLEISDLSFGNYAIALFHDINGNGLLDQNFIGIPTEPYAFSKPPRSRWRLPRFKEVKFELKEKEQVLEVRLERW